MNPDLLEVVNEFNQTLNEVEVLISTAEENISDNLRYSTYIKSAILLLSGKFENFLELISDTYIYQINKSNLISKKIPESIKLSHSYKIIEKIKNKKSVVGSEKETRQFFNEIGAIWVLEDQPFSNVQIECKFSYGKHGEEELIKLFSNIGINNIFDQIQVIMPNEDDPTEKNVIDFKGTFNTLTGLRNNILHQNASPNLTHLDVLTNLNIIKTFSNELSNYLDNSLVAINTV